MNRRAFVTGLGAVLAAPLAAEAQQAGKVYRVGVLSLGPPSTFPTLMDAFRKGMRDAGYVEGTHYVLELRNAAGKPEELPEVARTLIAQRVDVILVGAGSTLSAVAAATQTLPIVIAGRTTPLRRVSR
jgi:putative ABC transport system substrate-binding protein